jgi:hypothetical protein
MGGCGSIPESDSCDRLWGNIKWRSFFEDRAARAWTPRLHLAVGVNISVNYSRISP